MDKFLLFFSEWVILGTRNNWLDLGGELHPVHIANYGITTFYYIIIIRLCYSYAVGKATLVTWKINEIAVASRYISLQTFSASIAQRLNFS